MSPNKKNVTKTTAAISRSAKGKALAKANNAGGSQSIDGRSADFNNPFSSRNVHDDGSKAVDQVGMSTFQTRFSRDSSKNNILGSLNEFFVSAKSVNHKIAGATGVEMRRQRSEMLIDRTSRSIVPAEDTNSNN